MPWWPRSRTWVDHAFFVGDTPKGPGGLPGAGGAVVHVPGDPASGLDPYTDAIATIESVGASPSVIWMNGAPWAALSKIKTSATDARPVLNPQPTGAGDRSLQGLPVRVCKHCPAGTAYVADAGRLVVVDRQPASVEVNAAAAFTIDGTYVRAIQRIEFGFPEDGVVARIATAAQRAAKKAASN